MRSKLVPASLAAVIAACATAAMAAPPFWGSSYAEVAGVGDTVLGQTNGAVRVGALLPPQLACMDLVRADAGFVPGAVVRRDPMTASPVTVVLAPGYCPPAGEKWLRFVVAAPGAANVLELTYVSTDGGYLGGERLAVRTSTGP